MYTGPQFRLHILAGCGCLFHKLWDSINTGFWLIHTITFQTIANWINDWRRQSRESSILTAIYLDHSWLLVLPLRNRSHNVWLNNAIAYPLTHQTITKDINFVYQTLPCLYLSTCFCCCVFVCFWIASFAKKSALACVVESCFIVY